MTNKELFAFMLYLDPVKPHEPDDGYEYIHVIGTDEIVECQEHDGWSIVADWEGDMHDVSLPRDVIMHRKLAVYPHDRIIGPVRRALEL